MDAIAEKVIGLLCSLAYEEFGIICNLKDDKQEIVTMVSAIKAVLKDAESNANNHQVSDWLEVLKDVLFDADDLLDDFSTEALRKSLMTGNKITNLSRQLPYASKMGHGMKEIKERLKKISDKRHQLHLEATNHAVESPIVHGQRQTYSFVREDEIIGREKEKRELKGYLFDANMTDKVSVISIVGIGGLGKTALAQLVYNDQAVQEYFELTMWVCVSDEFDVCKIAQNILGHAQNGVVEQVQQNLRNKIQGKKYLLVLDDVWNEDRELWRGLERLLTEGGKGSKIIVTTRSNTVGRIMSTNKSLVLKGLDFERSWKIFCRVAFDEGKEPHNSELVPIGKDIVKKCGGMPLAIRAIGSLLFSRNLGQNDWEYFRDDQFSKIEQSLIGQPKTEQHQNKIFSILKLSYDHLPSCVKNCFAFCSLFPQDYEIDKVELIRLWIAVGFIELSGGTRREEDIGHEYFMYLLSRNFFQDVTMDDCGGIRSCKMHDLIHDLAELVAGNEYVVFRKGKEANIENRTRHVSSNHFSLVTNSYLSSLSSKGVKVRTLLSPKFAFIQTEFSHSVFDFISSLKCLRALTLDSSSVEVIPKSIKELKHLRYLRLSSFFKLKELSPAITSLPNLQTLLLLDCPQLKELPSGFRKLTSLRHLVCHDLKRMPRGVGELSCLQTLRPFILGPTSNLTELKGLINLRHLCISRLGLLRNRAGEVEAAKVLLKIRHLQELELWWGESYNFVQEKNDECLRAKIVDKKVEHNDEKILQGLQPQNSIKKLSIDGFCGESLPEWMGNLSSLISLTIGRCEFVTSLPEGIHNLKSLQRPRIFASPPLEDRYNRDGGQEWCKIAHIPNA